MNIIYNATEHFISLKVQPIFAHFRHAILPACLNGQDVKFCHFKNCHISQNIPTLRENSRNVYIRNTYI